MAHEGEGNFLVHVRDASGLQAELAANAVGAYTGSRALRLEDEPHTLDVEADGAWTVDVARPADAQPLTGRQVRTGDAALGPFVLAAGTHAIALNHPGAGSFIVRLLDETGATEDTLLNQIGKAGKAVTRTLDAGRYWLDVQADGAWNATVR